MAVNNERNLPAGNKGINFVEFATAALKGQARLRKQRYDSAGCSVCTIRLPFLNCKEILDSSFCCNLGFFITFVRVCGRCMQAEIV